MSYTSSIIIKYGDEINLKKDAKIINEIIDRQGISLLIETIAEYTGNTANKFQFNNVTREKIVEQIINELKSELNERV